MLARLREAGNVAVIPPWRNGKRRREDDRALYIARHLVASFFCTLKQFHGMAARCDKAKRNSLAGVYLAATFIALNYRL